MHAPLQRRHSVWRFWRVGALASLLVLSLAWLYSQRTEWLAAQWRHDVEGIADDQAIPRMRQAAELGEPGLAVLAAALCSPRMALFEAAGEVLEDELHRWRFLPAAEAVRRRTALAEALAAQFDRVDAEPDRTEPDNTESADADMRSRAADVALGLLNGPPEPSGSTWRITVACERVLRARPVDGAATTAVRASASRR